VGRPPQVCFVACRLRPPSNIVPLRIYTRTGDDGTTGLFGGRRVSKADCRVEAYGSVDELNAQIGLAVTLCPDPDLCGLLLSIQHDLFSIGADLATPPDDSGSHGRATVEPVTGDRAQRLESEIDRLEIELEPLRAFILPGGSALASHLHVCRSVCRRAERRTIALSHADVTNPEIIRYLNRLSDFLFVAARVANARAGVADVPWCKDGNAVE
jgi:cob(I)alamin adenosyltransferase